MRETHCKYRALNRTKRAEIGHLVVALPGRALLVAHGGEYSSEIRKKRGLLLIVSECSGFPDRAAAEAVGRQAPLSAARGTATDCTTPT